MEKMPRKEREQLERRELLISAAEELFLLKGYEATSIDDLAARSEYTKRTLYRYFTCKEDMYFAVLRRGYGRLLKLVRERIPAGKTGYEKVCLSFEAFHAFYQGCPAMLKLMNLSGAIKYAPSVADVPYRQEAISCENELFDLLRQLFAKGQADGSIRGDREAALLAFTSIFLTTGFFQLLAQSGKSYSGHFALEMEAFVRCAMEMITGYLNGMPD